MEKTRKINKIPRRKFLNWILPLAGTSAILFSFKSIYSGSINTLLSKFNQKLVLKSSKSKRRHKNREIWHNESLVLNTKTNVVHYPSIKLFTYYNKVSDKHISLIGFEDWKTQLISPEHFIKSKSGIILESLVLRKLSIPITTNKLDDAIENLSIAFSNEYHQYNTHNWRLYDLLLQLIAMNPSIKPELKWSKFLEIIKLVDFKFLKIPKRNSWVKSNTEFNKRVKYIQDNLAAYTKRIEKRIG